MTTETVLTDDDLVRILKFGASSITMGRAIEQAVLQSPEVQQMRKDAERYRWLRSEASADIVDCIDCSGPLDGQVLDAVIDDQLGKRS